MYMSAEKSSEENRSDGRMIDEGEEDLELEIGVHSHASIKHFHWQLRESFGREMINTLNLSQQDILSLRAFLKENEAVAVSDRDTHSHIHASTAADSSSGNSHATAQPTHHSRTSSQARLLRTTSSILPGHRASFLALSVPSPSTGIPFWSKACGDDSKVRSTYVFWVSLKQDCSPVSIMQEIHDTMVYACNQAHIKLGTTAPTPPRIDRRTSAFAGAGVPAPSAAFRFKDCHEAREFFFRCVNILHFRVLVLIDTALLRNAMRTDVIGAPDHEDVLAESEENDRTASDTCISAIASSSNSTSNSGGDETKKLEMLSSGHNTLREGFLEKRGLFRRSWERRYFHIQFRGRDGGDNGSESTDHTGAGAVGPQHWWQRQPIASGGGAASRSAATPNSRQPQLLYFLSRQQSEGYRSSSGDANVPKPKGTLELYRAVIESHDEPSLDHPGCHFSIIPYRSFRRFLFSAPSAEERAEWVACLRELSTSTSAVPHNSDHDHAYDVTVAKHHSSSSSSTSFQPPPQHLSSPQHVCMPPLSPRFAAEANRSLEHAQEGQRQLQRVLSAPITEHSTSAAEALLLSRQFTRSLPVNSREQSILQELLLLPSSFRFFVTDSSASPLAVPTRTSSLIQSVPIASLFGSTYTGGVAAPSTPGDSACSGADIAVSADVAEACVLVPMPVSLSVSADMVESATDLRGTASEQHVHVHADLTRLASHCSASVVSAPAAISTIQANAQLAPHVPHLSILHFNDVYHITATKTSDPVGGADRFLTVLQSFQQMNRDTGQIEPLVLFSGDCFSPSILSSVTKGSHMVPVLNMMGVHAATIGNHDEDFGDDVAARLVDQTNFPWILSNVFDGMTGAQLAGTALTKMLEWYGIKIGILGLAEKEWIDTLPILPAHGRGLEYRDFVTEGRKVASKLREDGADLVIALTHMREPNDVKLAAEAPEIDLVLGGHDHHYVVHHTPPASVGGADSQDPTAIGTVVVKSGCDFRNLTLIRVYIRHLLPDQNGASCSVMPSHLPATAMSTVPSPGQPCAVMHGSRVCVATEEIDVNKSIVPHMEMSRLCELLNGDVNCKLAQKIGEVDVALDTTFQSVRGKETNIGNLITDILRRSYHADVALVCGGTIRSEDVYGPGDFTLRDVLNIFPFEDPCVLLRLSGQQLLETIENGVNSVPKLDGRFLHVSGLRYVFDPARPPGQRISEVYLYKTHPFSSDEYNLDPDASYVVATRSYMAAGNDGFVQLPKGQKLVDEEHGTLLSHEMRNFFRQVQIINQFVDQHGDRVHSVAEFMALFKQSFHPHEKGVPSSSGCDEARMGESDVHALMHASDRHRRLHATFHHGPEEKVSPLRVAPVVEGRILTVEQASQRKHAEAT